MTARSKLRGQKKEAANRQVEAGPPGRTTAAAPGVTDDYGEGTGSVPATPTLPIWKNYTLGTSG